MKRIPYRIGYGYDVHAFACDRELWLGGIMIPYEKGLDGHSDADVVLHAISDAVLGALALGDIGIHFPPDNEKIKGIDSKEILRHVVGMIREKGYCIGNVDVTIVAEKPKMKPHIPDMQKTISDILDVDMSQVSIKATTSEKMGFTGREEGIACSAVALLMSDDM